MDIRNAILKAADSIDNEPHRYAFSSGRTPDCGSPSCMFGWIGYHLGLRNACNMTVANAMGLRTTLALYDDVQTVLGGYEYVSSHGAASKGLRLYADLRYPAPAIRVPDWSALSTPDAAVLASVGDVA